MSVLRVLETSVALLLFFVAPGARADPPPPEAVPRFGERMQLVLTADRLVPVFGYTTQSVTAEQGDATTTVTDRGVSAAFLVGREPSLNLVHTIPRVAGDVTVARRLTVGGSFALAFGIDGAHVERRTPTVGPETVRENNAPGASLLGFAPRVGYVVPIRGTLVFWPRLGFGFYSVRSEREETSNLGVTSTATVTDTLLSLDLDPQLVWLPIPRVLVHFGPLANLPLTGSHETVFEQAADAKDRSDDLTVFHFGLSAGLGVWLDL